MKLTNPFLEHIITIFQLTVREKKRGFMISTLKLQFIVNCCLFWSFHEIIYVCSNVFYYSAFLRIYCVVLLSNIQSHLPKIRDPMRGFQKSNLRGPKARPVSKCPGIYSRRFQLQLDPLGLGNLGAIRLPGGWGGGSHPDL